MAAMASGSQQPKPPRTCAHWPQTLRVLADLPQRKLQGSSLRKNIVHVQHVPSIGGHIPTHSLIHATRNQGDLLSFSAGLQSAWRSSLEVLKMLQDMSIEERTGHTLHGQKLSE